jgi:hypothetical protein
VSCECSYKNRQDANLSVPTRAGKVSIKEIFRGLTVKSTVYHVPE